MELGEKSEGEAERSLRDDLAAGLKEIEEREAVSAPEGAQAPQAQAEAQAPEPEADRGDGRDAHGRFVKKEESAEEPKPDDQQQGEVKEGEQVPADEPQSPHDAPPKSWRADEQKLWSNLPPEAKAVINRREAEAARLAGANDAERMFGREIAEVFRPHMEVINSFGVSPQFALKGLLDNDRVLRFGTPEQKLAKARQLVTDYGIDPALLAQSDPNAPDANVLQLQQQIAQLQQRISQPQAQQFAPLPPSAEEGNIMAEIEAFRADPAHPHFDAVHVHMGKLLETGAAPDLESAYQAAVAMNPALRSTVAVPAPQRTQEDKTAAARRAAASVTGSPGPSGNPTPLSLRDELRENLRNAGFSV